MNNKKNNINDVLGQYPDIAHCGENKVSDLDVQPIYLKPSQGNILFVTLRAAHRKFTNNLLQTCLLTFAFFILGSGASQAAAVQLTVEAHRNSVVQSRPDFGYFSFFDLPVVNKSGQIAFMANYFNKNQGGNPFSALWTKMEGGQITPLVEDGMEATSISATTYFDNHTGYNIAPLPPGRPSSAWINDYGEIAFSYYLEDTTDPGNTFPSAWVAEPGGNLHPVVYAGMPRPDSGTFTGINYDFVSMGYIARLLMNADGQVAFIPAFNEIWQETPACDSTSGALDKLTVQNTENADMKYYLANDGTVLIFDAQNDAILSSTKNQSQALVSKGQTLPGMATGETLSSILAATFNRQGSFAFLARSTSNLYLYVYESGVGIRVVKKDPSNAYTPLYLLDDNRVVYGANQILGTGNPKWGDIWLENTLIAKQGDFAPGSTTGQKLNSIYVVGANNQGQVVFKTIFTVGGSEGVYAWDGSGSIVKVIQTGDIIEVAPGVEREVFKTVFNTASNQNSQTVINDLGKIVFVVNFNNSTSAIVSAQLGLGTGVANGICPATRTAANYVSSGTALGAVNTFTGELVLGQGADLDLGGGPLPLYFERYYASSLSLDANNALGNNWRHNFEISLNKRRNTAQVVTGEGRIIRFKRTSISGNTWELAQPLNQPYQLVEKNNEAIFVDQSSNIRYAFNTQQCGPRRLSRIQDHNNNALTLNYDTNNMLSSVSDGLGRNLDFTYDADNHLVNVSDRTRQVAFNYDADNNLASYTDPKNKVTSYSYDSTRTSCGLLDGVTLPDGKTPNKMEYNQDGRVSKFADSDGHAYTFDYSENATTVTSPVNGSGETSSQVYGHNNAGKLVAYTDEDKKTVKYTYNSRGQLETVTDRLPTPGVTTYAYDDTSGKIASLTNPDGTTIGYEYKNIRDADGIDFYGLSKITNPDTTTEKYAYDPAGNVISYTDQAGNVWPYVINSNGQLGKVTNPNNAEIIFGYNADGTLSSMMDDKLNTTLYSYDGLKRYQSTLFQDMTELKYEYDNRDALISATDENLKTTTLAYDDNGNLQTITDPLLNQLNYGFDTQNRFNVITDPNSISATIAYDEQSRIKEYTDFTNNKTTFGYDSQGRLNAITGASGDNWGETYDAEGRVSSITDPLGRTSTFQSDSMGRITQIADPLGHAVNITQYDSNGRITAFEDKLGNQSAIQYDQRGLVSSIDLPENIKLSYERNALGLVTKVTDPGGDDWISEYDNLGRITANTDPLGNSETYAYDVRNRLSKVTYPDNGTLDIEYDGTGNATRLLYQATVPSNTVTAVSLDAAVTDALGYSKDVKLVRDEQGHLLYDEVNITLPDGSKPPVHHTINLKWDNKYPNRLVESNGIEMQYDADGKITKIIYPGTWEGKKREVTYLYNNNRLKEVIDWTGTKTTFEYDSIGRLTKITRPNNLATVYHYYEPSDPAFANEATRMGGGNFKDNTSKIVSLEDPQLIFTENNLHLIAIDKGGKVGGEYREGLYSSHALTPDLSTQSFTYRRASQVAPFDYDKRRRIQFDGERSYGWDHAETANLTLQEVRPNPATLENSKTVTNFYGYDATGRRIDRYVTVRPSNFPAIDDDIYTYDWNYAFPQPKVAVTTEKDGEGKVKDRWFHIYSPNGNLLLHSVRESDNKTYYYHFDLRGHTNYLSNLVTNGDGSKSGFAVIRYYYSTDGSRLEEAVPTEFEDSFDYDNPFTFHGQRGWMLDTLKFKKSIAAKVPTPLYYTGSGYYSSKLLSFLSPKNMHMLDPARFMIHSSGTPPGDFSGLNRAMGGLQVGGSILVLILIPEPTSTIAGVAAAGAILLQVDNIQAGVRQMYSGEYTKTCTNDAITELTGSETAGFVGDCALNILVPAGATRLATLPAAGAVPLIAEGEIVLTEAQRLAYTDRLFWHASEEAVERAMERGLLEAVDVGNGGKHWATSLSGRNLLTDILIGGNHNVESLNPLKFFRRSNFLNKGGLEAVYTLTPEEAFRFSRAWGFKYSWNPYQWYKGAIGQFVYHPGGVVPWAQRATELKRFGSITGISVGTAAAGEEILYRLDRR